MYIAIGSTNPVKNNASKHVLSSVYANVTFTSVDVPSGVSDQPWGNDETRRGAFNRAKTALVKTKSDMAIGLEGGVQEIETGLYTCAWCVIVDQTGKVGIGGNSCVRLPDEVATAVRSGLELGAAMDQLTGQKNTKHQLGAIGFLTNGLSSRQEAYEILIKMALAPFLLPEWYGE
jgi:inosine/xanthosine triphosphatase